MSPETTSAVDRLTFTLERYDEALLRKVAARLVKPRGQWPAEELIRRCAEVVDNPPVLDRRLADLPPAGRDLLGLIGKSRKAEWPVGNVIELLMALGQEGPDAAALLQDLLEAGVLFPVLAPSVMRIGSFGYWLSTASAGVGLSVFTLPQIAGRITTVEAEVAVASEEVPLGPVLEADGLEWLLRLGVLWQRVSASPLRRTQQGGLFKRDVDRIEQDALLNGTPADRLADVPDLGFLLAELGECAGVVTENEGEVVPGGLPPAWDGGLWPALEHLFPCLFGLRAWGPIEGWKGGEPIPGNPYPSAYLLVFMLLSRLPEGQWARPAALEDWVRDHHPYWLNESLRPSRLRPWGPAFLLGACYPLRLVQATRDGEGELLVRLSPFGRWLMGTGEPPTPPAVFAKTLLVQPNLEVLAYRQGLTPALVVRLTRMATWKTLGPACTLQLEPDTVYRALEAGETFETLTRVLEQHGTRTTPAGVLDLLRTWSNKRDRIVIYPAAALLEFGSAKEMEEALSRGVTGVRATDTLLIVPTEDHIEFRHFRLAGTRDYALPAERCVTVEPDGVTLSIDLARSDLMLETELPRFADLVDRGGPTSKRQYRLTPASMARARESGWMMPALEAWFQQRVGSPATPAAKLLLAAAMVEAPELRRHLVLHVASVEIADGLEQWPETRGLIAQRLGPTALAIDEVNLDALRARLAELGVSVTSDA